MRNPRFWRMVALCFFVSGAVAAPASFLLPEAMANDVARAVLFCYGATALLFGGGSAFFRHRDLRAAEALARGEDVLGRWHVDGAAWRAFIALDRELNGAPGALLNELSVGEPDPEGGIDVIVGMEAVQVGGSIHTLPRRGTPEITHAALCAGGAGASYLAFELYYPGGGHGASGMPRPPRRAALRFPVAPGAFMEAQRAAEYYGAGRPGEADFFHGRGDGTDAEDVSECIVCGFKTHHFRSHCPQCGAGLQSKRWSRRFGVMLALCGVFISAVMGAVSFYAVPLLLHPGVSIDGNTFVGSAGTAAAVLGIFGVVLVFGLTSLGYGVYQIATGRRSGRVIYFLVGLWSLLGLIAYLLGDR